MLFANDIAFSVVDEHDVAEAVFQAAARLGLHGKNNLGVAFRPSLETLQQAVK